MRSTRYRSPDCSCCARCGILARAIALASGACYATIDLANPNQIKRGRKNLHLHWMDNNIHLKLPPPRVMSPMLCHNIVWRGSDIWTYCRVPHWYTTSMASHSWARWTRVDNTLEALVRYILSGGSFVKFRAFYMHKILMSPVIRAWWLPSNVKNKLLPSYIYHKERSTPPGGFQSEHIVRLGILLQFTVGEADSFECCLKQARSTVDPSHPRSVNSSLLQEQTYSRYGFACPPHKVLASTTHWGLMKYLIHYHRIPQNCIRSGAHFAAKVLWNRPMAMVFMLTSCAVPDARRHLSNRVLEQSAEGRGNTLQK